MSVLRGLWALPPGVEQPFLPHFFTFPIPALGRHGVRSQLVSRETFVTNARAEPYIQPLCPPPVQAWGISVPFLTELTWLAPLSYKRFGTPHCSKPIGKANSLTLASEGLFVALFSLLSLAGKCVKALVRDKGFLQSPRSPVLVSLAPSQSLGS